MHGRDKAAQGLPSSGGRDTRYTISEVQDQRVIKLRKKKKKQERWRAGMEATILNRIVPRETCIM